MGVVDGWRRDDLRAVHPEPEGLVDPDRHHDGGVRELEGRVVHDQPERQLVLGRQEGPGHLPGLRVHAPADRQPEQRPRRSYRVQQPRSDALHAQGAEAGHVLLEDEELLERLPVRSVRELAVPVLRDLSGRCSQGHGLQQDLDELHLRFRRCAGLRRPVLPLELHQGPGHGPEGQPVLDRQEAGHRRG